MMPDFCFFGGGFDKLHWYWYWADLERFPGYYFITNTIEPDIIFQINTKLLSNQREVARFKITKRHFLTNNQIK